MSLVVMIDEGCSGPDKITRRVCYLNAARNTRANLVVQSFLVHNDSNVFGELAYLPGGRENVVREQGEQ